MTLIKEPKEEKIYTIEKSKIIKHIFTKIGIFLGLIVFILSMDFDNGWNKFSNEESFILIFFTISICFVMLYFSSTLSNYRTIINDEYIKFQPLLKFMTSDEYNWRDIKIIIIGDVEVKNIRFNYNVYGVEIFYKDNYYNKLTSDVYKLEHLQNYQELISGIEDKCNRFNIKYEYSK